uniref:Uncharacterized protein n=1 Tax=Ralstonia solanacearum TaxID=305 RepID=A0A0S4UM10_RALSL|nr:protein of unknown function [Ralstonia solanacearum]CUV22981.1 protein of unknown function [Ralstonia solanacearum]CUV32026.1 protein of unknown function [Ralstonia solanacearum]CUV35532.1 protein of unknown function [Ralstonia solanacearum]CUV42908.1 protein of unknown function [Ralstonia solanacearum]
MISHSNALIEKRLGRPIYRATQSRLVEGERDFS